MFLSFINDLILTPFSVKIKASLPICLHDPANDTEEPYCMEREQAHSTLSIPALRKIFLFISLYLKQYFSLFAAPVFSPFQ